MDYESIYSAKLRDRDFVLGLVSSGDHIAIAAGPCEPAYLLEGLSSIAWRVRDVTILSAFSMRTYEIFQSPQYRGCFLMETIFYGPLARQVHELQMLSYVPGHLHSFATRRLSYRKPRFFWGAASPMDSDGKLSLSLSVLYEREFLASAEICVLEVNKNLPRTFGDTLVSIEDIDYVVESDWSVPEIPPKPLSETDQLIGKYVAELIEDGSTIQLGLGHIPNAVASCLDDKHDLGIHSEILPESVVDLWYKGIITGAQKTLWKGKIVCAGAIGTKRLYAFLNNNRVCEFHRASIVNDPAIIALNSKMVSINTALQVDLTGQCCSESLGPRQWSGTGGVVDFVVGAQKAHGGKSIIALPSTASEGTVSRIVPFLSPGAIVSVSRNDVDYVVTEFGIARLTGRSVRERVANLIAVAHPDFRQELMEQARRHAIW